MTITTECTLLNISFIRQKIKQVAPENERQQAYQVFFLYGVVSINGKNISNK